MGAWIGWIGWWKNGERREQCGRFLQQKKKKTTLKLIFLFELKFEIRLHLLLMVEMGKIKVGKLPHLQSPGEARSRPKTTTRRKKVREQCIMSKN